MPFYHPSLTYCHETGKGSFSMDPFLRKLKETAAVLLSLLFTSPHPDDPSDDFTDDFHISGTKEKAETLDKYKEFRLLSSSGRET